MGEVRGYAITILAPPPSLNGGGFALELSNQIVL
jgi:hypothetical protein